MRSLELDHIFCFCEPQLSEAVVFESHGFSITAGRSHPGQGTANRSILFHENYFELIYLSSEEEAAGNSLKLHRRAQWLKTGASPFGIALRGSLSEQDRIRFWEYSPAYLPSGSILIHKDADDRNPLIFIVPPRGASIDAMYPSNWANIDKHYLAHSTATNKILSVELEGPGYRWPLNDSVASVTLRNSVRPHMRMTIDGKPPGQFAPNALTTVVVG